MKTWSKKGWLFIDFTILGYISTLALAGILRGLPLVDILYIPGFFVYGIQPWSLVPFIGFMLLTMKLKGYREGLLFPLFAAGFYDLTASVFRDPPVAYPMNYVIWTLMLAIPYLASGRLQLRYTHLLPMYLITLPAMNFIVSPAFSLETRYIFELFACSITLRLFSSSSDRTANLFQRSHSSGVKSPEDP